MSDNNLLFVEGRDDEHVFKQLLGHYQVPEGFKIQDKQGIDKLLATLPTTLRVNSELDRLGIVIDADLNLGARWDALKTSDRRQVTFKIYQIHQTPRAQS